MIKQVLSSLRLRIRRRVQYVQYWFLRSRYATTKFIKEWHLYAIIQVRSKLRSPQTRQMVRQGLVYGVKVWFTGILIMYAITNFNAFSLGLVSGLAMYYIEWFVTLIKKPYDVPQHGDSLEE